MVMFHHISYAEAYQRGKVQADILTQLSSGNDSIDDIDWQLAAQLVQDKLEPISKEFLH